MAFYHRKLLPAEEKGPDRKRDDDRKYGSGCLSCYDCPYPCTPYPPPPSPQHQIPIVLILSLCIFGAGFLCLSYFAIRRYCSRRRNSLPSENDIIREDIIDEFHGPVIDNPIWYVRTVGLPQSVIDSIEVFTYKTGEGLIESSDCSVCLSEFQEEESLRLLPKCSHAFHVACIDTWLRSHKNCPVCRAPVMIGSAIEVNSEGTSLSNSESTEEEDEESDVEIVETGEMRGVDEISSALAEVSSKENEKHGRVRVWSDLADHRVKVDRELEPVRRSVSLDFSSASTVYMAVANVHAKKDEGSCNNTMFHEQIQSS